MSLVGTFVQFDTDDEHFQVGKLTYQINETLYLFQPQGVGPKFMLLFDLYNPPENVFFFENETALNEWLDWLQKPDAPAKIIQMKKTES